MVFQVCAFKALCKSKPQKAPVQAPVQVRSIKPQVWRMVAMAAPDNPRQFNQRTTRMFGVVQASLFWSLSPAAAEFHWNAIRTRWSI